MKSMTTKDVELLFDWLCRNYGYPASQNRRPYHRSRSAKTITNAIMPPIAIASVGCSAKNIDTIAIRMMVPRGAIHMSAATIASTISQAGGAL